MDAPAQYQYPAIHTLGPQTTDSCAAAEWYVQKHQLKSQIKLHQSFEELLAHLSNYSGELLIMPAAFQSTQLQMSWGDIHYLDLDKMELLTSFVTRLDELVLIHNTTSQAQIAWSHAATVSLLTQLLPAITVKTACSKYQAYQQYRQQKSAYVLTNQKNVQLRPNEEIIKHWQPKMIWGLYQII